MWQRLWFHFLQLLGRDPRGIFHYWDGHRWRCGDPIVLARGLMSHPVFDWDSDPQKISDPDPIISSAAIGTLANTVREVFGVPSFSDGGLTEAELCNVFWGFQDYLANVKKNGSGPQMSPLPTEQWPRSPADVYPTKPESDSGSTPNEPEVVSPGM